MEEMEKEKTTPLVSKDAFLLACFALVTTGLCVLTLSITESKIQKNISNRAIATIAEVAPRASREQQLLSQWVYIDSSELGLKKAKEIKANKKAYVIQPRTGKANWVLPLRAPDGYGGPINLLMGISEEGEITGIRVIPPHNETPGLGDKIDIKKSQWITRFNGRSLTNTPTEQWAVNKEGGDFDAFTGATITPRAVIKAVHQGLIYFNEQKEGLNNTPLNTHFISISTNSRTIGK